ASTMATMSGRVPPMYSTERQPHMGIITELINPAVSAPTAMPLDTIATSGRSIRFGAYSDANASTFGRAPPRPRPVRNRKVTNWLIVVAWAVAIENIANVRVETTTIH